MLDTEAATLRDVDRQGPLCGALREGGGGTAPTSPQLVQGRKGPPPHQHPQPRPSCARLALTSALSSEGGGLENPRVAGREAETPEKGDSAPSLGQVSGSGQCQHLPSGQPALLGLGGQRAKRKDDPDGVWLPEAPTPMPRVTCCHRPNLRPPPFSQRGRAVGRAGEGGEGQGGTFGGWCGTWVFFSSTHPTLNTAPLPSPGPHLPLEEWLSACLSVCPRRAVLFASMLMRKTMASRVRATILFATETGKSETLAQDLGALFSCAFNPKVSEAAGRVPWLCLCSALGRSGRRPNGCSAPTLGAWMCCYQQ